MKRLLSRCSLGLRLLRVGSEQWVRNADNCDGDYATVYMDNPVFEQGLPAGTYTFLVDPVGGVSATGTLTLYDADDATGPLTVGGPPVAVTTTRPGQHARYRFAAAAGQQIVADLTGWTSPGRCSLGLRLLDANGQWIRNADNCNGDYARVRLDTATAGGALPASGVYTLVVDPTHATFGSGTLTLSPSPAPAYDPQHHGSACTGWTANVGDPVNAVFGNFLLQQEDFALPGRGPAIALTRSYNSAHAAIDAGFGYGWGHTYGMRVIPESSSTLLVQHADCRRDRYTDAGGGNYTAPAGIHHRLVKNADGTYALTTPGQANYRFDASGRLTSLADRDGNRTTLAHTAAGVTVTDPAGKSVTLAYGTGADAGHIVSLTEAGGLGRTVGYKYSPAGDLVKVTDVRGGVTRMTYDGQHRLLTVTDATGTKTIDNMYDAEGRVVEQRDAGGRLVTLAYDRANRRTTRTDERGLATTYTYDAGYRVTGASSAAGDVAAVYDAANQPTAVTDGPGGGWTTPTIVPTGC